MILERNYKENFTMYGIAGNLHWKPTLEKYPVVIMCDRIVYRYPEMSFHSRKG
jgi:hypothetical protein|tara:strand:- start:120 stop:278 length:159 start_codon:yes stop_codon:yes gene_type:complete